MTKLKRERKALEQAKKNSQPLQQVSPIIPEDGIPDQVTSNFTLDAQPLQIAFNHTRRETIITQLTQDFNLTLNTTSNLTRFFIVALNCFAGYIRDDNYIEELLLTPVFDTLELNAFGNWSFTPALLNFTRALNESCLEPELEPYWTDLRIGLTEIFVTIGILAVIGACVFKACCIQPVHAQDELITKLRKISPLPVPSADYFLNAQDIHEYKEFIQNTVGQVNRDILAGKLSCYSRYIRSTCILSHVPVTELTQPITIIINPDKPELKWSCTADVKLLIRKIESCANPELQLFDAPPIKLLAKSQVKYVAGHDPEIVRFINSIKTGLYKTSRPLRHRPTPIRINQSEEKVSDNPTSFFAPLQTKKKANEKTNLLEMASPNGSPYVVSIN